jgi:hypothetical protein
MQRLGVISDGGIAIKPFLRFLSILTFRSLCTSVFHPRCWYLGKERIAELTRPSSGA